MRSPGKDEANVDAEVDGTLGAESIALSEIRRPDLSRRHT